MYFWKVDKLVTELKEGSVTQYEEFKYMLLFTIVTILVTDPILYSDITYNSYDFINSILFISISCAGTYLCYKLNKQGDDKDFIKRVMCIGLPVAVRVFVLSMPIVIICVSIEDTSLENTETYETTLLMVVVQ